MKKIIVALTCLLVAALCWRLFAQPVGGMNEKSGTPTYQTELHVLSALVGNVALIVDTVASATADIADFRQNGTNVVRVGASGHVQLRQYTKTQIDTLVPDYAGAEIIDTNGAFPYNHCISTGTAAAQWQAVLTSTGGFSPSAAALGGTRQFGCGTNN